MTPLKRVLVPTDFSPGALHALARAALLPLASGSKVTLLHVLPGSLAASLVARERAEAEHRLRAAAAGLARRLHGRRLTDVRVHCVVLAGEPFSEIVREADRVGAELIVLGRHGTRRFRDLLLGSTAERVIRKGAAPVLITAAAPPRPYRRPWAALDLSDPSRRALQLAVRLAAPTARQVRVVQAYDAPFESQLSRGASARRVAQYRRECRLKAEAELAGFLAAFPARGLVGGSVLRRGDPRRVVLGVARRERADLLAVGTQGRTGLPRLLLGSVSEAIIHHAKCDVLVVGAARSSTHRPSG